MVLFSSDSGCLALAGGLIPDNALLVVVCSSMWEYASTSVNVENNRHKKPSFRCGFNFDFRNGDLMVPGTIIAFRIIINGRIHADIGGSSATATNKTKFNRARMITTVSWSISKVDTPPLLTSINGGFAYTFVFERCRLYCSFNGQKVALAD